MSWLHDFAIALATITLVYFATLNVVYLAFTAIAWRDLNRHLRARGHAPDDEVFSSPVTPPVSVLVPAHDEERTIVESVRSLLALRYPLHEVIVVNDGSSDATLERLCEAFDLVPVRKALRVLLPTASIRGVYVSRRHRHLWVVDKENGGKADALNAAVNASRYPYVLAIDADAILEEDSLSGLSGRSWRSRTSSSRPAGSSASPTAVGSTTAACTTSACHGADSRPCRCSSTSVPF